MSEDVALAVRILAVDPALVGGLVLRARAGPARDRACAWLSALLPAPMRRMPLHISEDRLLGGLDLPATLRTGKVVCERGLLAEAHGGVVLAAMAERLEPAAAAHLCAALDRGEVVLERDGITEVLPARIGVVALDEGIDDERVPAPLLDRLAFHLQLEQLPAEADPAPVEAARALLPQVTCGDEMVEALCGAALSLGIASVRASIHAISVARIAAALEGRTQVTESDAAVAARLVLGPRATRAPVPEESQPEPEEQQPEEQGETSEEVPLDKPLEDLVLEAAASAMPAGLLDALTKGLDPRSPVSSQGKAGALRATHLLGRPAGVRRGTPGGGRRLNVVETLRAAAPWQKLRRRAEHGKKRVEIRPEDFRITRYKQRSETTTIFAVDASGSAALQRLAEAKGAVEQVLADCYVRRDNVALIAFRGAKASLLLPPTRSLVRARRCLSELPGGGTTPLASGIDAALAMAAEARKRGQTPLVVFMTDGRANVDRKGGEGREQAEADAQAAARAMRASGVRVLFLDTAPRPRPAAQALAAQMGARYFALPYADSARIAGQVQLLADAT